MLRAQVSQLEAEVANLKVSSTNHICRSKSVMPLSLIREHQIRTRPIIWPRS